MKRSNLAMALIASALLAAGGPTRRVVDAPYNRPPGIRRYKAIDFIGRTKQHDQQEKLARRADRSRFDDQLWQRQRAKWG
jgi:hypothetical protein